jgi:hypothetical protein
MQRWPRTRPPTRRHCARRLPAILWQQVIREQRATFSCRPGLHRPAAAPAYVCATIRQNRHAPAAGWRVTMSAPSSIRQRSKRRPSPQRTSRHDSRPPTAPNPAQRISSSCPACIRKHAAPPTARRNLLVMGDEDQRGAAFGIDREHQLDDLMTGGGVEIAGRLVGEHQPRLRCKGAGQGQTRCCSPPGEMLRIMPQAVRQPDPLQPALGLGAGVGGAGEFQRQHDVFERVSDGSNWKV